MKKFFALIIFFVLILSNPQTSFSKDWFTKKLVVRTLKDGVFNLKEQEDKVVIVMFWATWCGPCHVEMANLNNLYKKYAGQKNLEIIALGIDGKIDETAENMDYLVATTNSAKINEFENPRTIPLVYIIDKKNRVRAKISSPEDFSADNVENIVQFLAKTT